MLTVLSLVLFDMFGFGGWYYCALLLVVGQDAALIYRLVNRSDDVDSWSWVGS